MAGCFVYGYGPADFIFLDQLDNCHLLKNDPATFRYLYWYHIKTCRYARASLATKPSQKELNIGNNQNSNSVHFNWYSF